jgi:signal peptidase
VTATTITPERRWGSPHRRSGASARGRHRRPEALPRTALRRFAGLLDLVAHLTLATLMLGAVALFLVCAIGPHTGKYRTVTMLTGSMRPHYPVGAVLIDRPQPISSLRVGQVLTYGIPIDDHRVFSHRVIDIRRDASGAYLVRTKGDANNGPDPWIARITDKQVWTARAVVPHVGSVILTLRNPHQAKLALYVIPAVCAVWTLMGVWRRP